MRREKEEGDWAIRRAKRMEEPQVWTLQEEEGHKVSAEQAEKEERAKGNRDIPDGISCREAKGRGRSDREERRSGRRANEKD